MTTSSTILLITSVVVVFIIIAVAYFEHANISNCHKTAWRHLISGEAEWLCLRFTAHSKWHKLANSRLWKYTIGRLGIGVLYIAWTLIHIGEMLRTGRWFHLSWLTSGGKHREYVPEGKKIDRYFPPVIFRGITKDVELRHSDQRESDLV